MKYLFAALTFFTRLPFWRLGSVDKKYYKAVVPFWPFTGWITGAVMCLVLWGASQFLPYLSAIVLALLSRVMVTGALHEDGLADFCDGIGGGHSRQQILSVMKDSHTGTYGIIGLLGYFLLASSLLLAFPPATACCVMFAADPWCKFCAAQTINFLPYARNESEAKNKLVYDRMSRPQLLAAIAGGVLPLIYLPAELYGATLLPVAASALLIMLMKRRINGYTGDCCGASFLICELTFYIGAASLYYILS